MSEKRVAKRKITLKEALRVVATHREAERMEERMKLRRYIGRYFKYRNNYSCPETDADYWWMYAQVREIEDWNGVYGLTFQIDKDGRIEIHPRGRIGLYPDHTGDYVEIDAEEFRAAAREAAKAAIPPLLDL